MDCTRHHDCANFSPMKCPNFTPKPAPRWPHPDKDATWLGEYNGDYDPWWKSGMVDVSYNKRAAHFYGWQHGDHYPEVAARARALGLWLACDRPAPRIGADGKPMHYDPRASDTGYKSLCNVTVGPHTYALYVQSCCGTPVVWAASETDGMIPGAILKLDGTIAFPYDYSPTRTTALTIAAALAGQAGKWQGCPEWFNQGPRYGIPTDGSKWLGQFSDGGDFDEWLTPDGKRLWADADCPDVTEPGAVDDESPGMPPSTAARARALGYPGAGLSDEEKARRIDAL